jgi:hypothetical protein
MYHFKIVVLLLIKYQMHVLLLRYLDDVILMKRSTRVYSPWFSGVRLLNHKFLSALRSLPLYQYFVFLLFSVRLLYRLFFDWWLSITLWYLPFFWYMVLCINSCLKQITIKYTSKCQYIMAVKYCLLVIPIDIRATRTSLAY